MLNAQQARDLAGLHYSKFFSFLKNNIKLLNEYLGEKTFLEYLIDKKREDLVLVCLTYIDQIEVEIQDRLFIKLFDARDRKLLPQLVKLGYKVDFTKVINSWVMSIREWLRAGCFSDAYFKQYTVEERILALLQNTDVFDNVIKVLPNFLVGISEANFFELTLAKIKAKEMHNIYLASFKTSLTAVQLWMAHISACFADLSSKFNLTEDEKRNIELVNKVKESTGDDKNKLQIICDLLANFKKNKVIRFSAALDECYVFASYINRPNILKQGELIDSLNLWLSDHGINKYAEQIEKGLCMGLGTLVSYFIMRDDLDLFFNLYRLAMEYSKDHKPEDSAKACEELAHVLCFLQAVPLSQNDSEIKQLYDQARAKDPTRIVNYLWVDYLKTKETHYKIWLSRVFPRLSKSTIESKCFSVLCRYLVGVKQEDNNESLLFKLWQEACFSGSLDQLEHVIIFMLKGERLTEIETKCLSTLYAVVAREKSDVYQAENTSIPDAHCFYFNGSAGQIELVVAEIMANCSNKEKVEFSVTANKHYSVVMISKLGETFFIEYYRPNHYPSLTHAYSAETLAELIYQEHQTEIKDSKFSAPWSDSFQLTFDGQDFSGKLVKRLNEKFERKSARFPLAVFSFSRHNLSLMRQLIDDNVVAQKEWVNDSYLRWLFYFGFTKGLEELFIRGFIQANEKNQRGQFIMRLAHRYSKYMMHIFLDHFDFSQVKPHEMKALFHPFEGVTFLSDVVKYLLAKKDHNAIKIIQEQLEYPECLEVIDKLSAEHFSQAPSPSL